MREVVRAIVVHNGQLLLMHRHNEGKEYYNLIGGGIESNESKEQALLREVDEETGVTVKNPRQVFKQNTGTHGMHYYFVCDYVSGEPALRPDSGEAALHAKGENRYEPLWMPIETFKTAPFVSESLRQAVLAGLNDGWPKEPVELAGMGA